MSALGDDTLDRKLHDFLDGRLTREDRDEVEARLRDDPELAARLETYREIGGALRDDGTELPPGFHARARARFEADRPAGRHWFRPLSWETLGVAAAAVLALAVFVPQWVGDGTKPVAADSRQAASRRTTTEEAAAGGTRAAASRSVAPADTAAPEQREPAGAAAPTAMVTSPPPPAPREKGERDIAKKQAFAPAPPDESPVAFDEGSLNASQAESQAELRDSAREASGTTSGAGRLVPATAPARALAVTADEDAALRQFAEGEALGDELAEEEVEVQAAAAKPERSREAALAELLELGDKAEPFAAQSMQGALVARGEVLVLEDLDVLRRQDTAAADTADPSALHQQAVTTAADDATPETKAEAKQEKKEKRAERKKANTPVRWVLIGPRDRPFACAGFKIAAEDDAWVIGLSGPTADHPAAAYGCALTLPRDGKDVRVEGP